MKLIVLAAGKWTRLRPLTNTIPKPLINICGKSILEHNLESLYEYVNEIIIVVKYLEEKIKEKLWDNYKWVKITYHRQVDKKGTWAALLWINSDSDVCVIYWDSIFDKKDFDKVMNHKWYWVLAKEVENPEKYEIFNVN